MEWCLCLVSFRWVFLVSLVLAIWGSSAVGQGCNPMDSRALLEFAGNLTDGSILEDWPRGSDCCSWIGVVCGRSSGTAMRRVKMLTLQNQGLQGIMSTSLGQLDQLKFLDLSLPSLLQDLPRGLGFLAFNTAGTSDKRTKPFMWQTRWHFLLILRRRWRSRTHTR